MDTSQQSPNLAERVRNARARMDLTQAQFAARMAVTPLTVHRWETGQSLPRPLALDRLRALEESVAREASRPRGPAASCSPESSVPLDFAGDPAAVALVAEAYRLAHAYQFNAAFASETARIAPLPHQRIAVYERMLPQEPLRFLLADDAGAGKTIMTGLYVREMLFRQRIHRVLIVPPAGLVGNWERELRTLFRLQCRIVAGSDIRSRTNPFAGKHGNRVIISLDTLTTERAFATLRDHEVAPYDLVVFDEAHKLGAFRSEHRVSKTQRYQLAEALAGVTTTGDGLDADTTRDTRFTGLTWAAKHLLLLTATPHMGKWSPYHHLWRLLDHHTFDAEEALRRYPHEARQRHFIRRTKEEMVDLAGNPLYRQRRCGTFTFDLSGGEQTLYERTTAYLREHYNRALHNRPAAQLAMSVFQRRLASSTYALLRSFERRIDKLERDIADWQSGRLDHTRLAARERALATRYHEDFFESHGADEDVREDGPAPGERNEDFEDAVLGAITAVNIEELRREVEVLHSLRACARELIEAGDESKFEKLREVLEDPGYAKDKWLVFSEHRNTVDFLVRRIEGLGYSDQVAVIHGGMDWPEREEQVERFRHSEGARFLVATDAAGEGINLQFCRLMVSYDIPWNPARLEQRMGRIHRYGQRHDVHVINLVAGDTWEGRVLKALLDKLESVRLALSSDKVFDVIGHLLQNISLRDYMTAALTGDDEQRDLPDLERALSEEALSDLAEREARLYGASGEVAPRLPGMRRELDRERYLHLLPAYVRLFVESAATRLGIDVRGDLDEVFSFQPGRPGALDPLLPALEGYPPEVRTTLRVRRPHPGEQCIWLHPGEPVFDALSSQVINSFSRHARRGAIFIDPRSSEAGLWHLVAASIEERASGDVPSTESSAQVLDTPRRTLDRRLLALRQSGDETLTEGSAEALLLLKGAPSVAPGSVALASRALALRAEASALVEHRSMEMVEEHRTRRRAELPEQRRRVNVNFDLQSAALAKRRSAMARATTASSERELAELKRQQAMLATTRTGALQELDRTPDRIQTGPVRFLAHLLTIPPPPEASIERWDERVETIAVRIAVQAELDRDAQVQDVSTPERARAAGLTDWPGFDLISRCPDGEVRSIEVKGCAGRAALNMELNEWRQACNLGKRYWLYAVFDCATPKPQLYRVQDPFRSLLASEQGKSTFTITVGSILKAAEAESPSRGRKP